MESMLTLFLLLGVFCSCTFGENLSGNYGCLASPGYPGNYPNSQMKSYHISVSKGSRVELTFHKFDLEAHGSCAFDYVEIVDPSSGSRRKYCGTNKPQMQISRGNSLTVNFRSDGSVQLKGFFASFVATNGSLPVVDGGWCPFNWTSCSVSCGNGYIYGQRSCNCPSPSNGGRHCQGSSSAYRNCSRNACVHPSPSPSPMPSPTLPPNCDRVMTANYGYFSSPNYPNNYPNNARCSYSISAPSGRQIVVRVHYYDIENEGSCRYDKLEIKAGNTILASLCGSNNNTVQYIARTNQVSALFRSDGSVTRRGFYASYYTIGGRVDGGWCNWQQATPCSVSCGYGYQILRRNCSCPAPSVGGANCTGSAQIAQSCYAGHCPSSSTRPMPSPTPIPPQPSPSPSPSVCRHSFTAASGSFSSPGYPGNYPNNANCEYSITVQTGKAVKITFSPFSVENGQGCGYDSVKIYEGGSLKRSFCGDGSKTFTAKKNSVRVVFRSDGSVAKSGFRAVYTTVDEAVIVPARVNHPSCGLSKVSQSRVIGGKDAAKGAWPWQIAMYKYGFFACGGSLIAPNWVLTASHCISSRGTVDDPSNVKVVVGDLHRQLNDTTERTHDVELILAHPSYSESTLNNDIALMKLATPAIMNDHVNTVCIPNKTETIAVGSTCFITGWGKIQHPGNAHTMLQQAKLPVLDSRICQAKLDKLNWGLRMTDQMVCAGEVGSIKSGCHGDSGGPYVCPNKDGRFILHGDVSWGSPQCNTTQAYTVFARTTEFTDWVVNSLQNN